ncbi:MAG: HEAT repeat domain-containing protein, partial [Armatimonadia bacterium]
MRLFLPVLLILALLIASAGQAAPTRATSERSADNTRFDGKTVSQWLQQLRTDDADRWHEAANALMMNGDQAVGPLTKALDDKDARVRRGAAQGLRQLTVFPPHTLAALRKHLQDPSLLVRADVCETLAYANDDMVPVVAAVRSVLASDDPATREAVLYVFHLIPLDEEPCLNLVFDALKHKDPSVRVEAAEALDHQKNLSAEVAGPLRLALGDPDVRVRVAAASSYWTSTGDPAPLPGLLVETLRSAPMAGSRAAAAGVLAQMGERAKDKFAAIATAA